MAESSLISILSPKVSYRAKPQDKEKQKQRLAAN